MNTSCLTMPPEKRHEALRSLHDLCSRLTKPHAYLLTHLSGVPCYRVDDGKIIPLPNTPEQAEIFKDIKNILDAAKRSWRKLYEDQGWDMSWAEPEITPAPSTPGR